VPKRPEIGQYRQRYRRSNPAEATKKSLLTATILVKRASHTTHLQAGGHRFDPGWLHWRSACKDACSDPGPAASDDGHHDLDDRQRYRRHRARRGGVRAARTDPRVWKTAATLTRRSWRSRPRPCSARPISARSPPVLPPAPAVLSVVSPDRQRHGVCNTGMRRRRARLLVTRTRGLGWVRGVRRVVRG